MATEAQKRYWKSMKGKNHGHRTSNGYYWKHTDEAKKKMSETKIGDKNPMKREDVRKKVSESKKKNPTRYWLGKKRDENTRIKISRTKKGKFTGKLASNWKGGKSKRKDNCIRQSLDWRLWRKTVFERDNYTCRWCFVKGVYIEPHHIYPKSKYPELQFNLNNGITLCRSCHCRTLGKEREFVDFFLEILSQKE